jgi:opacity protein-like surface antigen
MQKFMLLLALFLLVAGVASAQDDAPKFQVFGGYSYIRATDQGNHINFNGGSVSASYNLRRYVDVVADFGLYHGGRTGVSGNLVTSMGGPKFAYRIGKFTPFAQALFGAGHASIGASYSFRAENAFAAAIGAGVDAKVSPRISVRLIQIEHLITKFDDGDNNQQSDTRVSAGFVYRF